ncbi:hypothetical protein C8E03_10886 [Lachnotalea glycerini]|uniref:Uncharacterized protein n=1 Tax=Lachnotalea glycerini TaxID=1763509 RepID=A0A255I9S8_9FIRM|nr:hypothetical protein [Lachnotalea glycerini]PXV88363.1 hypothetical protein C8E03_10886 [Lachnotalea glycerini]RDY29099.1 hypothetical protein CG710_018675 [Lachnotalea glycerini]
MKLTVLFKNLKRSFVIVAASSILISIPVSAYGGTFNFKLTFNSDNDNAQSSYAYRDEIFLGENAYVTVLKQKNAHNNLKMKLLKYYADTDSISEAATSISTYTNSCYQKNLTLTYKSNYIAKDGAYKLYGYCSKSDCTASGNWRP